MARIIQSFIRSHRTGRSGTGRRCRGRFGRCGSEGKGWGSYQMYFVSWEIWVTFEFDVVGGKSDRIQPSRRSGNSRHIIWQWSLIIPCYHVMAHAMCARSWSYEIMMMRFRGSLDSGLMWHSDWIWMCILSVVETQAWSSVGGLMWHMTWGH